MRSLEQRYPHLSDPRPIVGPPGIGRLIVGSGHAVAEALNDRAAAVAAMDIEELPATVLIQGRHIPKSGGHARKDTPERRMDRVIATAENIRAQQYGGHVAIAASVEYGLVPTMEQREKLSNLRVMTLAEASEVNASAAVNVAVRHLRTDSGLFVPIAAGNRFATTQALRAASLHVGEGAVGVYGPLVLDRNPNKSAYGLLGGESEYYQQEQGYDNRPTPDTNGFMTDAGAALSADTLSHTPLDEAYGRGGGVREWAARLQEGPGDIWYDPALAVHDSRTPFIGAGMLLEEAELLEPTEYIPSA